MSPPKTRGGAQPSREVAACAECGADASGPWRVRCEIDFGFGPQSHLDFCRPDHMTAYFSAGRHRSQAPRPATGRAKAWFTITRRRGETARPTSG